LLGQRKFERLISNSHKLSSAKLTNGIFKQAHANESKLHTL